MARIAEAEAIILEWEEGRKRRREKRGDSILPLMDFHIYLNQTATHVELKRYHHLEEGGEEGLLLVMGVEAIELII